MLSDDAKLMCFLNVNYVVPFVESIDEFVGLVECLCFCTHFQLPVRDIIVEDFNFDAN